ncbi:peptidoglycan transglycosylase [Anopheles sinensis]|uniref:Peptidoglycan transglycosylase n=1 Tax=Anopheles sinensis TaxID=74873 RepID=A0A084WCR7_ANOSI|nr:peptidoglycan transglycosylase [Anopheles sinensis]
MILLFQADSIQKSPFQSPLAGNVKRNREILRQKPHISVSCRPAAETRTFTSRSCGAPLIKGLTTARKDTPVDRRRPERNMQKCIWSDENERSIPSVALVLSSTASNGARRGEGSVAADIVKSARTGRMARLYKITVFSKPKGGKVLEERDWGG